MSTITAPVQDMLPIDLEDTAGRVYDGQARSADRELCQRYFGAWTRSFGNLDGTTVGHPEITFAEFQMAADRLAEHAEA